MENSKFERELTKLLLEALDRHLRLVLAEREVDRPPRDSKAARENSEMLALLDRQATERAELRKRHRAVGG